MIAILAQTAKQTTELSGPGRGWVGGALGADLTLSTPSVMLPKNFGPPDRK